jgi:hypothetical protein
MKQPTSNLTCHIHHWATLTGGSVCPVCEGTAPNKIGLKYPSTKAELLAIELGIYNNPKLLAESAAELRLLAAERDSLRSQLDSAKNLLDRLANPNVDHVARVKELEALQDKACAIIINLWVQYGYTGSLDKSQNVTLALAHDFMGAGEAAVEFLEDNGCARDTGQHAEITTKGLNLSEWDGYFIGFDELSKKAT